MTIKECIDAVDTLKPNEYSITDKVRWLSFVDEKIINDVLKTHEGYDNAYDEFKGYSDDALTVMLIAPSPYDRLYPAFIVMQIDYENGDTQKYQNSNITFNSYLMEYKRCYNKTHKPLFALGECKPRPVKPINKLSQAEIEAITRDLEYYISDEVENATSDDVIYDIVMKYVNNNAQMLKGKDGKQGKDGLTPYIADNGNWWIGYDDTGVKAKGQDGTVSFDDLTPEQKESLKGEDGKDGKDGKDGITPDMSNYYNKAETNDALGLAKDELQEQIDEVSESLSGYVKGTDLAELYKTNVTGKAGIVRLSNSTYGLYYKDIEGEDRLAVYGAKMTHIDSRQSAYMPITPSTIDYAVKKALSDCRLSKADEVWTEGEKANARALIGALGDSGSIVLSGSLTTGCVLIQNGGYMMYDGQYKYIHEGNLRDSLTGIPQYTTRSGDGNVPFAEKGENLKTDSAIQAHFPYVPDYIILYEADNLFGTSWHINVANIAENKFTRVGKKANGGAIIYMAKAINDNGSFSLYWGMEGTTAIKEESIGLTFASDLMNELGKTYLFLCF